MTGYVGVGQALAGVAAGLTQVAGTATYGPLYSEMRKLSSEYDANSQQIRYIEGLLNRMLRGDESAAQEAQNSGVIVVESGSGGGAPSIAQMRGIIGDLQDRNEQIIVDLARMPGGADFALAKYPSQFGTIIETADKFSKYLPGGGGGGGGGGGAVYRPTYQFEFTPAGDLYRIGSDGTFEYVDNIPGFAQRNVQVVTDQRTGEAWAIATDNEGNVVNRQSLGQYSYPEIDPERVFQREIMFKAAEIEAAFAGLEIQRRGLLIDAIGNDMAMQIQLGRMTYEEANTRLNIVSEALNQRRLERQDILKYGVTRESLRTNAAGETVTRLPFAEQTAAILSSALGQQFTAEDFELGVTYVNPEQAAQDVISNTQFTSPIPGLTQGLQASRQAISNIFAEPIGDRAIYDQLIRMATQGM